jgi:hypothetical protein
MGINEKWEALKQDASPESLDVEGKMVLLLSVSYYLAERMASVEANPEGVQMMREALGQFYSVYRSVFPEGPLAAQAAIQQFAKKLGVVPEDMWKERPN